MQNELLIGASIGGFLAYYLLVDQRKAALRKAPRKKDPATPDNHMDHLDDDQSPLLQAAHPASILGERKVDEIESNDAFEMPAVFTDVKEETMSLREYQTGKAPRQWQLEGVKVGKKAKRSDVQTSAIPWVKERSHVAAEQFLRSEGLIRADDEVHHNDYFDNWPEPDYHPYKE